MAEEKVKVLYSSISSSSWQSHIDGEILWLVATKNLMHTLTNQRYMILLSPLPGRGEGGIDILCSVSVSELPSLTI